MVVNRPLSDSPLLLPEHADRRVLGTAVALAVAAHLVFLLLDLPEPRRAIAPAPPRAEPPTIHPIRLPPPPHVEPPPRPPRRAPVHALLPGPQDPSRDELITDPPDDLDLDLEPPPVALDLPLPPPEPPPVAGPRVVTPEIEPPVLIESTKVAPAYPETARLARIPGAVVLQAVILADGSVGEIEVLRCDRPGLGFEQASIEAVSQWRYRPARMRGEPVSVFFTIRVEFELQ